MGFWIIAAIIILVLSIVVVYVAGRRGGELLDPSVNCSGQCRAQHGARMLPYPIGYMGQE